ncbi:Uroporphyrinogen III synthase HEM4 [Candidatus Ruthia magnifica str. Cm (Calyptogena magnifica)]|uniref:Uroporphyrinogen-III synthase n=1 Tax=Ruthia magnifica subsp. Calyptogena magnifica TaxID=413404 RepID=A1AXB3_RUTMC|nr:uroporphyrinogen-III synthase [Candidatus Ruthturnera calyptogenae]ABL02570.1 Uroporphyrinogen III synthase HEM4 [Candidatus Ruthia magnifica str. Cm (Calyptogena magnifica)]
MNVLLTRPLLQVEELQSMVTKSGNKPLLFPTLKLNSIDAKVENNYYDVIIFISVNAVEYGLKILKTISYHKIFAVGSATARKLSENDIEIDDFPRKKASSEALLALDSVAQLYHKTILIFRGQSGREVLKQGLIKQNNQVEYVEVYERVNHNINSLHRQSLDELLSRNEGVISITSIDSMKLLVKISSQILDVDRLKNYLLVVLSDRIKTYVNSIGFNKVLVTPNTSNNGIISVLTNLNTLDKPVKYS